MPKMLLGKKVGMTQIFNSDGRIVPVTVIEAGPCYISQIKTGEHDGYEAVQISFEPLNKAIKPLAGHFAKSDTKPMKYMREMRLDGAGEYQLGQELKADIFAEGDKVNVVGTSKGKGFAGTIKRWNQQRGPMGHGSKNHRRPASAGAKGPARVFKGKHSPGQMGGERVMVKNLEVVKVDIERNLLLIRGAVPGAKHSLLMIKSAVNTAN